MNDAAPLDRAPARSSIRDFAIALLTMMTVLVGGDGMFRDSRFSRSVDRGSWMPVKRALLAKSGADIVVVGSSVIAEGMSPTAVSARLLERTGKTFKVFNGGVSAGGFAADFLTADTVLEIPREARPKYFVVSFSPTEFSCCPQLEIASDTKWANTLRLPDLLPLLSAAPTFEEGANDLVLTAFRLLAIRPNVIAMITELTPAPPVATWPADGGGGGIPPVDASTQDFRARHRAESFKSMMLKPKTVDRVTPRAYLTRMVSRLRAGGVKVAFIGNPQAPQMAVLDGPDSIYPEFEVYLRELAASMNVSFTSMREMEGVTASDFVDGDHLDRNGSVKFSNKLADEVLLKLIADPAP